jgi:hypothetical protein
MKKSMLVFVCLMTVACPGGDEAGGQHRISTVDEADSAQPPPEGAPSDDGTYSAQLAVNYADTVCEKNADCTFVPAGTACGDWHYAPIAVSQSVAHVARWEALQETCVNVTRGPAPPEASRCSRWSSRCFLSEVVSYECVDLDMQNAKQVQLDSRLGHWPTDQGCDMLTDVPGNDTYVKFTAATTGMHTFSLASGELLKGMQILRDDCQTTATTCVRCGGGPCETTSWLREGDVVVLVARNCFGDCVLSASSK